MAEQAKLYGSVKRFGVRYGTKLKGKVAKIESERQASTKCPYCSYDKVSRVAAGIWNCAKCKSRFTGKAYTIGGPAVIKEAITAAATPSEDAAEAEEEEEEGEETTEERQMEPEEGETNG